MSIRLTLAALALGLTLPAAQAETTPIFKAPISSIGASKSKQFAINADLGRAWVEIDVAHAFSDSTETYRVSVPGLSYDADKAQIVFASEGHSVVCATVRDSGRWIFKHQRIEPTGDCELTRKYVNVPIDDGFAVDVVEHFEVHFKPVRRDSNDAPDAARNG